MSELQYQPNETIEVQLTRDIWVPATYLMKDRMVGDHLCDYGRGSAAFSSKEIRVPHAHSVAHGLTFQSRVYFWVVKCLGRTKAEDLALRKAAFGEEALELLQSTDMTEAEAHALVKYVWSRPKGLPYQEVGGVVTCLASLCHKLGFDFLQAGEVELARINQPEVIDKIKVKQAAKPTIVS